jgi:hypothetical protein
MNMAHKAVSLKNMLCFQLWMYTGCSVSWMIEEEFNMISGKIHHENITGHSATIRISF